MSEGADRVDQPPRVKATTLLVLLAVGVILYVAQDAFIPVAMALFLALLLFPAVDRLQRWHVPRGLAVAIVMLVVGLLATLGPARRGLQIQAVEALRADA